MYFFFLAFIELSGQRHDSLLGATAVAILERTGFVLGVAKREIFLSPFRHFLYFIFQ